MVTTCSTFIYNLYFHKVGDMCMSMLRTCMVLGSQWSYRGGNNVIIIWLIPSARTKKAPPNRGSRPLTQEFAELSSPLHKNIRGQIKSLVHLAALQISLNAWKNSNRKSIIPVSHTHTQPLQTPIPRPELYTCCHEWVLDSDHAATSL